MQAIILAAGLGTRLEEITQNSSKCTIKVDNVTLIERMLRQLDELSLNKIVIVIGYKADHLMEVVNQCLIRTPIVFINNYIYEKSNNIYSLYLAKDTLLEEDTLLLESDLIFEKEVLDNLIKHPFPDVAVVSKFEPSYEGSIVTMDIQEHVEKFTSTKNLKEETVDEYYKTVNIYKLSKEFCTNYYVPFLETYINSIGKNEYYEQILKMICTINKSYLKGLKIDASLWHEIDNKKDLYDAELKFSSTKKNLQMKKGQYGGYWRYPEIMDYTYLVNPYFPSVELMDDIKGQFSQLIATYPSGRNELSSLAAKMFNLNSEQICVGNGAAELIRTLLRHLDGVSGIPCPTFDEYRKYGNRILPFVNHQNFAYDADEIIAFYHDKDIQNLILINPDNPSGHYLDRIEILKLVEWTGDNKVNLIIDESFIDFVDEDKHFTLLDRELLIIYNHVIVIKSISKSFGIPGIRLGIIASENVLLITKIKKDLPIWNINSFGEYFLQVYHEYHLDYKKSLTKFSQDRCVFYEELSKIHYLKPYPTQANYVMCEVVGDISTEELEEILYERYNILIKNLYFKVGIDERQFVRIAIKTSLDNKILIDALTSISVGVKPFEGKRKMERYMA